MHAQAVRAKGEDLGAGLHIPHIAHAIRGAHAAHPLLGQRVQAAQDLLPEHRLLVALIQAQVAQALRAGAEESAGSAISRRQQYLGACGPEAHKSGRAMSVGGIGWLVEPAQGILLELSASVGAQGRTGATLSAGCQRAGSKPRHTGCRGAEALMLADSTCLASFPKELHLHLPGSHAYRRSSNVGLSYQPCGPPLALIAARTRVTFPKMQPDIENVAYTAGCCTRQATSISALMTTVSMSLWYIDCNMKK